jgi:curved DNA-binding protein CbpA
MTTHDPFAAWRSNPFFVLEVPTDATPTEVERAGQRLLALLALGSAAAEIYQTPLGPATRDADQVRQALAALRDPERRVLHELWANVVPTGGSASGYTNAGPWEEAEHALGWSAPWAR